MNKFLTTTAVSLALAASPAVADETDIDQILVGVQTALNSIYAAGGGDTIDQAATNAGNIIARGPDPLDDVLQNADGVVQSATNYLNSTDFFGPSSAPGFTDVTQAATNVLNSLSMETGATAETVRQLARGTEQGALNLLLFDGDTIDVEQTAINAANLINAPDTEFLSAGGIEVRQVFNGGLQEAANDALGDDGADDLDDVIQAATNVANSISALAVNDTYQLMFDGEQSAINTIEIYDDLRVTDLDANTQDAVNAANLISITGDGDDLVQVAAFTDQEAYNLILGPSAGDAVEDVIQNATNVANSITGGEGGTIIDTIYQDAFFLVQRAGNLIDMGASMTGIEQAATNAANIAQFNDLIAGGFGTVEQYWEGGYQAAANVIAFGNGNASVTDLTQAATNVINSLSGDDINDNGVGGTDVAVVQYVDMSGLSGQLAGNFVSFGNDGGAGLEDVTQQATNAANLITLDELRGVTVQEAYMQQVAGNIAVPNLASFFLGGDIVNLDQSAVNAVNVISAAELPDILGATDVTQTATGFQLATNVAATVGSVSGVTQAATNVANSIGMP